MQMPENIFYQYPSCSTCRKAVKWLEGKEKPFHSVHIVENTPGSNEIKSLIEKSGLPFRKFFNTSGKKYRELGLKDKLPDMSLDEAADILASDGMLIKRPIMIKGDKVLVGFKEAEWSENL
jgi:arsenate reductase